MTIHGFSEDELIACIPRLRRYARKLQGFDSDDLVQQTLLHALEKRHLYQPIKPLLNWLMRIMHNLNATNIRKANLRRKRDAETIGDDSQDERATLMLQIRDLERSLRALSPDHQRLIISVCINDASYLDASLDLNLPLGTVRSRLSRTREKLRDAIQ